MLHKLLRNAKFFLKSQAKQQFSAQCFELYLAIWHISQSSCEQWPPGGNAAVGQAAASDGHKVGWYSSPTLKAKGKKINTGNILWVQLKRYESIKNKSKPEKCEPHTHNREFLKKLNHFFYPFGPISTSVTSLHC